MPLKIEEISGTGHNFHLSASQILDLVTKNNNYLDSFGQLLIFQSKN